jgi:excisionase family DNA binding protein
VKNGVLTTGEAARLCRVSQQAIITMVNRGHLKAWTLQGSRKRRIMPDKLREFMVANSIPTDLLDQEVERPQGREATP